MLSSKKKNRKKTRKKKPSPLLLPPTTQSTQIPDLPDDLLLSCFARVSRLHYPTLSLVSKRFRSLLASPELYKTRSLLGHTESCLYVYLRFYSDPNNLCWFTLCRRPNRNLTKTKKKQSSHLLVPITSPHSTPPFSSYTAVGSDIYEIGGHISGMASSTVSVFDCRSHTWHQAPSMQVRRINPDVKAIDGKIYVKGNIDYPNSDLVEVFDPKTQTWTYETKEWKSLDDYGGKMAVLWDRLDHSSKCKERNVWCAVIALERLSSDEIWGTLEWSEVVLKVPKSIQFVDVLSATV
ncbi:unnamed protein product [Microthlaspi erraticum]|uniref:F-box domain-containing protein n=1 Tax=Microthlaspi erraticum TaxID=1685480 RepID=A0A6D2I306_9BRAS|nr:unnamed protein product [Microthlaspi erraticum]